MNKKQQKHNFWFYLWSILLGIVIILLTTLLCIYLSVPTYSFKEPRPFEGEYLYNPYQNMQPDQWKKYHFHCHSRKFWGLTNGRNSKEETIDSVYQALGYDHYGISDYMSINAHNSEKEDYIPAYEHGYGLIHKTHQLCIGAERVRYIDYPFMQNLNMKQHAINKLSEQCQFVVPAHAPFTKGYKVKEMALLSNYRLLEVLNPYGNAFEYWDMALSNGHRVYAIGNDDCHNVTDPHEVCHNLTMVNTPDLKPEHVYDALDKGISYAVEFNNYYFYPQGLDFKVEKAKKLPYLTRAELVDDTLFIETSAKKMHEVMFIGQDGDTLKTQQNVQTAFYVIQPEDKYVRTKIDIDKLHILYLNPITRHPTNIVVDRRLDSINFAQTILYWIVYAVVLVAVVWYIIKKLKKDSKADDTMQ
ncbi:MAG: hypothetical protein MJZ94_06720 [Bacteroidales bacterium]|nr:hypothetical protein [Bacteroidales bacterium]